MHPNSIFRQTPETIALDAAAKRGFGQLAINGELGPIVSHVPFILAEGCLKAHLVCSNPIYKHLRKSGACNAVMSIDVCDAYISPDWYQAIDQVPTWNYIAVHLRGRLIQLPDEALRDMLDRQSAHFESRLAPKSPWTAEKMTPEVLSRMMRSIQPFRLKIQEIQGTWKLNQNKPDDVRRHAASMIEEGIGQGLSDLSARMLRART